MSALSHNRLVYKLALFMGLQSLIFYTLTTWLPDIYHALGASHAEAGLLLALFQFIGIPAALCLNVLRNAKQILAVLLAGYLSGLLLTDWQGLGWWLSALILGFTCALMFGFALNMIATSSHDMETIANPFRYHAINRLFICIGWSSINW